jgi:16S rRNA (uracil1498-N3)-methyltransferase
MHLFYQPDLQPTDLVGTLPPDEAHHALKTLRLDVGELFFVTNGRGNRFQCVITATDRKQGCAFRVDWVETDLPRGFQVRICVAPTKNIDRIEWFVEKAVELGIERISFFFSQHSERRVLKKDRIEKIAVVAMKQSLQTRLPQLDEVVSLHQILKESTDSQRFVAHLPAFADTPPHLFRAAMPGGNYSVLIGPEGDFSGGEIDQIQQAGFRLVSLGTTRLRTETAALAANQALNLLNA